MSTSSMSDFLTRIRSALLIMGLATGLTLASGALQHATAGCLQYPGIKRAALNWLQQQPASAELVKTAFVATADEEFDPYYRAPIVGLWAFKYISKGNAGTLGIPDGAMVDGGNTLWFADGNEMTYSGVRDPNTGAVCVGVWQRTGEHTYELNHIGLAWDPNSSPPSAAGPAFIRQHVVLEPGGNRYTGTFEINQLKPDGKTPAMPTIKGTILATRVTINTTTQVP